MKPVKPDKSALHLSNKGQGNMHYILADFLISLALAFAGAFIVLAIMQVPL